MVPITKTLHFFDPWGNLLFMTPDPAVGWNGIFREEPMNPGVLVWYVKVNVAICGRVVELFWRGM